MKHFKIKRLVRIIASVLLSVLLAGCSIFGGDRNWDMLLKSAENTEVSVAVVGQSDEYLEWLGTDFANYVMEKYSVRLAVKEASLEQLVTQLKDEKVLHDRGDETIGRYDLILFSGDGYAQLRSENLIYGAFADKIPNIRLIDYKSPSFLYRDKVANEGYFVPVARKMLTLLYSSDIFYESPVDYDELFDTLSRLKGYATYPDPRTTAEGEAFILGIVAEKVVMENYIKSERDLNKFALEVRTALRPLVRLRAGLMDAGIKYPTNIEQLFTDGKTYFSMSMDTIRVEDKITNYEYPDTTNSFVMKPVGTYQTVGVIPFNSENKSGAMVTISALLDPSAQAGILGTGLMTMYYEGTPAESLEPLKLVKVHRSLPKFSQYIEGAAPEFDDELKEVVIKIWEDMIIEPAQSE